MSTLLIATMAVATDLSIATHNKRALQNVTDAAALAGARQLPVNPLLTDEMNATSSALAVVHNSYPWQTGAVSWVTTLLTSGCPALGTQCSVTICAGLTDGRSCTQTVNPGSAGPFVLTVDAPPLMARVAQYNGDPHRVEVYMRQQSAAYFGAFLGESVQDAAESVAFHFAAGQPFPFALYSSTYVSAGNSGETITGNIYAGRYVSAQSSGHSSICAAPLPGGGGGYVFLGYPQLGDGSPPYANDGQSSVAQAPRVSDGVTCGSGGGSSAVGMSANPSLAASPAANCAAGYPGDDSGATITFDSTDGVCEANPMLQPPAVAALPNLPAYPATVCGGQGLLALVYQPGEYRCASGAALTVDYPLAPGIYEIDAGANTNGCDVVIGSTITSLSGVTFYLKGGAGVCATITSGTTLVQTPYNAGTGDPGDGRYDILSDNVAAPTVTVSSVGGGSTSGVWSMTGAVWLPSGTVTINNKAAVEDDGQVVVNTWNDSSGNHQNPSVTYNGTLAPAQHESLQLSE